MPSGAAMCKSRKTTSNFPSLKRPGASVLFVKVIASIPAQVKTFPTISRTAVSASTIRPRLCMSPYTFWRSLVRTACKRRLAQTPYGQFFPVYRRRRSSGFSGQQCGLLNQFGLEFPGYLVTVKLHSDAELPPRRINGIDAYDVARAQPFRCWFAGNFLGHLKKNFHYSSNGQR